MAIMPAMNASTIIDILGGNPAVAAALGEKPANVWRWRSRGIPARYWHRLAEMAAAKGQGDITAATLARPLWQRPEETA